MSTTTDSNSNSTEYVSKNIPSQVEIHNYADLIESIKAVETAHDLSLIIKEHVKCGNNKLPDDVMIFNIGSATDCPNLGTKHCQVGDDCYALKDERLWGYPLDYRRRQQIIWDSFPGPFLAEAFELILDRKRNNIDFMRLNESGDFRDEQDLVKAEIISSHLLETHDIRTFTYSASDYLDWSIAETLTLNASNANFEHADQRFHVYSDDDPDMDDTSEMPENAVHCDDDCTECHACFVEGGDEEVVQVLH